MKKILLISTVMTLAMSGISVFSEGNHDHMKHDNDPMMETQKSDMPNVGNTICPVSDEEIDAMGATHTVEYEGKVYNLCCKMCAKDFKKDPEMYIEKVKQELAAAKSSANSGHGTSHDKTNSKHGDAHDHGSH